MTPGRHHHSRVPLHRVIKGFEMDYCGPQTMKEIQQQLQEEKSPYIKLLVSVLYIISSYACNQDKTRPVTLMKLGSFLRRLPLASSREMGPQPSLTYSHNLNQVLFISATAGPRCGGLQLLTN